MTFYEGLSLWKYRIQEDIDHFDGMMPERYAVAWRAHLAGYAEWGNVTNHHEWRGITPAGYRELLAMIPPVHDDPAERIARVQDGAPRPGWLEPMSDALAADLTARLRRDIASAGGALPEREAIAWRAYLAALMLSQAISIPTLRALEALLPDVPDDPVQKLYGGRTEWADQIQHDIDRAGGRLPEREAIAWRGYLAALWEWGELNARKYHQLLAMVPAHDDPSGDIVREQDHALWRVEGRRKTSDDVRVELAARIQHDIDYFVGELPERHAIAWQAYLEALWTEDIITKEAWSELVRMTPRVPGDPVAKLFAKRND